MPAQKLQWGTRYHIEHTQYSKCWKCEAQKGNVNFSGWKEKYPKQDQVTVTVSAANVKSLQRFSDTNMSLSERGDSMYGWAFPCRYGKFIVLKLSSC